MLGPNLFGIRIRDLMSLMSVWYAGSLVRKNGVVRSTFHLRLHPVENIWLHFKVGYRAEANKAFLLPECCCVYTPSEHERLCVHVGDDG